LTKNGLVQVISKVFQFSELNLSIRGSKWHPQNHLNWRPAARKLILEQSFPSKSFSEYCHKLEQIIKFQCSPAASSTLRDWNLKNGFLQFSDAHKIARGSFHVNLTNWCHPGSRISKLIFFVDSTSNSKKKSHITFFSQTPPFWSRPF
jgi:hypothetical protein